MSVALANQFEHEGRELLRDLLRREPAKVIQLKTGARPRTGEGWKSGHHMPGFAYIGSLMAAYPDFARWIEEWARRAQEPDFFEPKTQAEYRKFIDSLPRAK